MLLTSSLRIIAKNPSVSAVFSSSKHLHNEYPITFSVGSVAESPMETASLSLKREEETEQGSKREGERHGEPKGGGDRQRDRGTGTAGDTGGSVAAL